MKKDRWILNLFNIMYVECTQDYTEIINQLTNQLIFEPITIDTEQREDICGTSPTSPTRAEQERGAKMAEDLIDKGIVHAEMNMDEKAETKGKIEKKVEMIAEGTMEENHGRDIKKDVKKAFEADLEKNVKENAEKNNEKNVEKNIDKDIDKIGKDNAEKKEDFVVAKKTSKSDMKGMNNMATCTPGANANCAECCAIFTDNAKRAAFGYQLENIACECHDICVQDVRDICVRRRTIRQTIPCNPDGSAGCRGGFSPEGPPAVQSFRVLCAEERLSPETGCDRIVNTVEFEVVLRHSGGTLVVVTPRDTFDCRFFEFARFPSGVFFPNNTTGLNQFRNELALIDGSCKVIIIENVRVVTEGNNCVLVIEFKAIDKLWKHENLLVSALKPYGNNITVKQEFGQGHNIGPCANDVLVADLAVDID